MSSNAWSKCSNTQYRLRMRLFVAFCGPRVSEERCSTLMSYILSRATETKSVVYFQGKGLYLTKKKQSSKYACIKKNNLLLEKNRFIGERGFKFLLFAYRNCLRKPDRMSHEDLGPCNLRNLGATYSSGRNSLGSQMVHCPVNLEWFPKVTIRRISTKIKMREWELGRKFSGF